MSEQAQTPATERHYTLREIADMWNISYQTARRMFQDQPGVLAFSMRRMGTSASRKPKRGSRRRCALCPRACRGRYRGGAGTGRCNLGARTGFYHKLVQFLVRGGCAAANYGFCRG